MFLISPAKQSVVDQSILHVDEDAHRSIDARQFFDGEDRLKERAAGAAELFRRFYPHQSEIETLFRQLGIEMALFVHGFDALAQFAFGKLAHAGAKHLFVLRKRRQRTRY